VGEPAPRAPIERFVRDARQFVNAGQSFEVALADPEGAESTRNRGVGLVTGEAGVGEHLIVEGLGGQPDHPPSLREDFGQGGCAGRWGAGAG